MENTGRPLKLSDLLDEIEKQLPRLQLDMKVQAVDVLKMMDEAHHRIIEAKEKSYHIAGSEDQYKFIQSELLKKADILLRALGGREALAALRGEDPPPKEQWWWYLDEVLKQKRRNSRVFALKVGGILLAIGAVLIVLYKIFLQPSPEEVARYDQTYQVETLISENRYEDALTVVEKAVQDFPEDPKLVMMEGVLFEILNQEENARAALENARGILHDDEQYYSGLSQLYMLAGEHEKALEAATNLLEVNPDSPMGNLISAQIYESLGQYEQALNLYEKASTLADEQGEYETAAIARMSMGTLMQQMSPLQSFTAEP